jgi:hypothetical protein
MTPKLKLALVAGAWALAVCAGLAALAAYSLRPGPTAHPPPHWPAGAGLELDPHRPTLVMAAHPQCPCTQASLEELAVIRARTGDRLRMHVLFVDVPGVELHSRLWRQAENIPDVEVAADPAGRAARQLGAVSSGYVVVYAPSGEKLFSGGITAARGHAGSNYGRSAILAIAAGQTMRAQAPPAFGCSLASPAPREAP